MPRRLGGLIFDDRLFDDRLFDDLGDGLAVNAQLGAGRRLDDRFVLVGVDRQQGSEDALAGHHLDAGNDLLALLFGITTTATRADEHEDDEHTGDADEGE